MEASNRRVGRTRKRGQSRNLIEIRNVAGANLRPETKVKVARALPSCEQRREIIIRTPDGRRIVVEIEHGDLPMRKIKRPSGLSAALTKAFHRGKLMALNGEVA